MSDKPKLPYSVEDLPLPPLGIGNPAEDAAVNKALDIVKVAQDELNKKDPNATVQKPHEAAVGFFKSILNWIKSI